MTVLLCSSLAFTECSEESDAITDVGSLDITVGYRAGLTVYESETEAYSEIHVDTNTQSADTVIIYAIKGAYVDVNFNGCNDPNTSASYGPELSIDGFRYYGNIEERFYASAFTDRGVPTVEINIVENPVFTVSFVSNGEIIESQAVGGGQLAVEPDEPTLEGFVFKGWFLDEGTCLNEFDFNIAINSDITLYAKWEDTLEFTTDPIADGEVVAIEGQPGTVSFRATSSQDCHSVLWDFGDGTMSTDLYSTHYYSDPGTYTATLTVFNNHGSDEVEYFIEVPSADPGSDGTEWALVAAIVLIVIIAGALIARRIL